MLESIILGIIFEVDFTGYDVKKVVENQFGIFYKTSFGSLYPALKRLVDKGFVTTYDNPQGGRKKIFYRITEEGKNYFLDWLTSPINVLDGANPNLIKVYFFDRLPAEIRNRKLQEYENNQISYLGQLEKMECKLRAMEHFENSYYQLSTLYYGILITRETIEWCRHIREEKPLTELI